MQKVDELIEQLLAVFKARHLLAEANDIGTVPLHAEIASVIERTTIVRPMAEVRRVTIVLSDLRGFTGLSERCGALETVQILNRYLERMSEIIVRHGGIIDKFMGDAIMVLFGAPITRGDDIVRALACAIEMQMAMEDVNARNKVDGLEPLYMGIGVNTGEVVAGHIGSDLHSEYTVIGDQVNLASRIEAHSLRGQILLSENTFLLARDFIETGDVNEVTVKGRKDKVRMYELIALTKPRRMSAPVREMRNSPRVDVQMAISFQLLQDKTVLNPLISGKLVDIGYGGLSIVTASRIEPFSNIKLALSLSLLSADSSEIYAEVLAVAPAGKGYECRVEFTSIDEPASRAVKDFVDGIVELNRR